MNGLEAVEMKLSEVMQDTETSRMDSEYFFKSYLTIENIVRNKSENFITLNDLELEANGSAFYPALEPLYNQGDYPFLRVGDIKAQVDYDNCLHVPFDKLDKYPTLKHVQKGDIVLTKGGTIAKAGLITKSACVSRDLIFINSSELNEKDYVSLFIYFLTDFAYEQLIRSGSQSVQPHLTITLVKYLPVFKFSNNLKEEILKVYSASKSNSDKAQQLYKKAETLLLDELGLHSWQPTKANTEVKSFKNSFLRSGRLDAEYYQPKYNEIEKAIRSNSVYYKSIAEIKTFNARGLQPEYFADGELAIINSKHILENTLDYDDFEKTDSSFWNTQQRARVYKDDILTYTTGANIGRTQIYLSKEKALASNHVNILRIKNENPIYVAFVMNSLLGRLQTEKLSAGSAQQELYPKDIDSFLIPFIDEKAQEKIANNVIECLQLQEQSQHLLQVAKHAVEIAIEQSEEAAMELIKAQTAL